MKIDRKDIRVTRTPFSTPGGRMKCGLRVLDGNGNVVSEIPPVPPCRQWIEMKPDLGALKGIDPGMMGDCLAYENPAP